MKNFIYVISWLLMISNTLLSTDWKVVDTGSSVESRAISILNDDSFLLGNDNGQVLISYDYGLNWSINQTPSNNNIFAMDFISLKNGFFYSFNPSDLSSASLFSTSDGGLTWVHNRTIKDFMSMNIKIYNNNDIYLHGTYIDSQIGPISIQYIIDNVTNVMETKEIASGYTGWIKYGDKNNLWIVTSQKQVYQSSDEGETWELKFNFNEDLRKITVIDSEICFIHGSGSKGFFTEDNGSSWKEFDIKNNITGIGGIYRTPLNDYLFFCNSGLLSRIIICDKQFEKLSIEFESQSKINYSYAVLRDSLVVLNCTNGNIILGDISRVNSINMDSNNNTNFNLFPNPFSETTTISYNLPQANRVTITIFDALGNEIAVPVNEYIPAGEHKAQFNGTHLQSGIYYYSIRIGSDTRTGKMILVK